jgi:hypothetical protein
MRKHRKVGISLIATIAVVGGMLLTAAPASAVPSDPHKVTLCHATNSATNPYVEITVDIASAGADAGKPKGGHADHAEPDVPASLTEAQTLKDAGTKWGDVIPAYDFGPGFQFGGLNLNANGIALLENNCQVEGIDDQTVPYRLVRRMPLGVVKIKLVAGLTPSITCDETTGEYVVIFDNDPSTETRIDIGTSRKGSILRVRSEGVVLAKVRAVDICSP